MGENDKGGNDQGVNVLGAKQLGEKMVWVLLGSTVDKDELELNNEPDFSIDHKPVILSQYVIV